MVAPCGFDLDGATVQPGPSRTSSLAQTSGRSTPGLVVRPGPRLVDGIEALAGILHPDDAARVPAGHVRRIS